MHKIFISLQELRVKNVDLMQVSVVLRLKALCLQELLCDSLWHTLAFYQNCTVKKYLKELEVFEEFTHSHVYTCTKHTHTHTYTHALRTSVPSKYFLTP